MWTVKEVGTLKIVGYLNVTEMTILAWCRENGYEYDHAWYNAKRVYVRKV